MRTQSLRNALPFIVAAGVLLPAAAAQASLRVSVDVNDQVVLEDKATSGSPAYTIEAYYGARQI